MKGWITRALALTMCGLMLFSYAPSKAAASTLEPQPEIRIIAPEVVEVGKSYEVTIAVDKVSDLYGFSFEFIYDPKLVQLTEVVGGDIFDSKGPLANQLLKSFDNEFGSASYCEVLTTKVTGVSGSGTLAVLKFKPVSEGNLPFSVSQAASEQLRLLSSTVKVLMTNSQSQPISYTSVNKTSQILLDTSAPSILGVSPENQQQGVGISPEFVITYNEGIFAWESFNSITLLDINNKPVAVNALIENNTLRIRPRGELHYSLPYRLVIPANALADEVGNVITEDFITSFVTEDAPEDFDNNGVINIVDVSFIANSYGKLSSDEGWAPEHDINGDEIINLFDLVAVVKKFEVQRAVYITDIEEQSAFVAKGSSFNLPRQVEALMSDGSTKPVEVKWNPGTIDTNHPGVYLFEGTVSGYVSKARLIVVIEE
jgi:hypothetical protein